VGAEVDVPIVGSDITGAVVGNAVTGTTEDDGIIVFMVGAKIIGAKGAVVGARVTSFSTSKATSSVTTFVVNPRLMLNVVVSPSTPSKVVAVISPC
jgi:hypothetical protein